VACKLDLVKLQASRGNDDEFYAALKALKRMPFGPRFDSWCGLSFFLTQSASPSSMPLLLNRFRLAMSSTFAASSTRPPAKVPLSFTPFEPKPPIGPKPKPKTKLKIKPKAERKPKPKTKSMPKPKPKPYSNVFTVHPVL
jgi:hypothetical protein